MIGIVFVASFAAGTAHGPLAKMTSTLSRARSAASSGKSSGLPCVYRCSKAMFWPSTYPDSRSPCTKASQLAEAVTAERGSPVVNMPIRETFAGWASAASADRVPSVSPQRNVRRFITE